MADTPRKADRFTLLPLLISVILAGLLLALGYTAVNFERLYGLLILTSLVAFISFLGGIVLIAVRLMRSQWRAAASLGIALALLVEFIVARPELYFMIDRARFQMFKDQYVSALTPGRPRTDSSALGTVGEWWSGVSDVDPRSS